MTAPIRSMPVPVVGELLGTVRTLQEAVDIFRTMKDRLGLTNEFIEHVGLMGKGHADKILGPTEDKKIGYQTFAFFCELMAIEFRAYVDPAALDRMEAKWEERIRPMAYYRNVTRVSRKLVERAKPYVYSEMGKLSAPARMQCLTAEHRSKIASKAAKSRWRKHRARKRATARQARAATSAPDVVCAPDQG